ncbi:hypothetical protein [Streptomyces chartreusis]
MACTSNHFPEYFTKAVSVPCLPRGTSLEPLTVMLRDFDTSHPTPALMTPFEASMCFESNVPADRVLSMRSVILPPPVAIAAGA